MKDLIEAVRKHAIANYESDGWDVLVECWSDEEIENEITEAGATTPDQAIAAVLVVVKLHDDYRRDVQGYAF